MEVEAGQLARMCIVSLLDRYIPPDSTQGHIKFPILVAVLLCPIFDRATLTFQSGGG
jgi:hypothetical protein